MTPITTRARVAAAVAAVRALDAKFGADTAISTVADELHLDPAEVAQIAAEEAHSAALAENLRRDIAGVGARSLGITVELADQECHGCGACKCGRKLVEA